MKSTVIMILLVLFITCEVFGRVYIILFDCSGSFIGPYVPEALKNGSLKKINELVNDLAPGDTLIFFPIRENSTVSSLNQIVFKKEKAKSVFDPTVKEKNKKLIKEFVKHVLNEINKPPAKKTDIISAINFASAIAKNFNEATLYIMSDGNDNISSKLFKRLDNISIFHLFIFDSRSEKQNELLHKWQKIYTELGAKTVNVFDAQASLSINLGIK